MLEVEFVESAGIGGGHAGKVGLMFHQWVACGLQPEVLWRGCSKDISGVAKEIVCVVLNPCAYLRRHITFLGVVGVSFSRHVGHAIQGRAFKIALRWRACLGTSFMWVPWFMLVTLPL